MLFDSLHNMNLIAYQQRGCCLLMNIIYLTLGLIRDRNQTDINSSLIREFAKQGHIIHIISPSEKREKEKPHSFSYGNVHYHYANIGNYYNTPWIEKGITTIFLQMQYIKIIKREMSNIKFDLALYSTPPLTFAGVISYVKKMNNARSFLLLKDIWPQSILDMGLIKKRGMGGIIYRFFKHKEKRLYDLSDYIGPMSDACKNYILKHNSYIKSEKVCVCPNALNLDDAWNHIVTDDNERMIIRAKQGVPADKIVYIFGGNIGNGHDPEFLEKVIMQNEERKDSFLLFVGKGKYYCRIKDFIQKGNMKNVKIIEYLPQREYLELLSACDVGLIVLDHRFSCPNYPSRLLSYLINCKPVMIAQDSVSDIGPVAENNGYGFWCESDDPDAYVKLMDQFADSFTRHKMGKKGCDYLKENFNTKKVYDTIMKCVGGSN